MLLISLLACADDVRIQEVLALTPDTDAGSTLYTESCSGCHGPDATGGSGPSMVDSAGHHSDDELLETILYGDGEMPAYESWPDQDLADVTGYLRSLAE